MNAYANLSYTAEDCWFGCDVPAYQPELSDGSPGEWLCMNCGRDTVEGRFCPACEAVIAIDQAREAIADRDASRHAWLSPAAEQVRKWAEEDAANGHPWGDSPELFGTPDRNAVPSLAAARVGVVL